MRLTDVRGYALSSPIDPVQERRFHAGTRYLKKRDVVLLVVETADGRRGYAPSGASSSAMREYFEGDTQETFADVLEDVVAPELEGVSLSSPAELHDELVDLELPNRLRTRAASAFDVAFHDLLGKEAGAPIATLLADRWETDPSTELPLYASAGMYMEPAGYVEQASILADLGFVGYKYRPGIGPDGDREILERLAAEVDVPSMIDAHTWWKMGERAYGMETIRSLVEHAGEHDAYWVEEPVEPDDYDGYRTLAETGTPLAGGESEPDHDGLCALAETGGVAFLQGDVRHHLGYTGCLEANECARKSNCTFVPHNFGTWLGTVANAHLVAAVPDADVLEYPVFEDDPALGIGATGGMYPFELAFDVIEETLEVDAGRMTVPDGPGLGVTVDADVIDRYPYVEGPWTEFEYDE